VLRRYGPLIILMLLGLQGAVFLRAMDGGTDTIFCTFGQGWLPAAFRALHLGFALMAVLGLAALRWRHLGRPYVVALILGLVLLAFQPALVASGQLTCATPEPR
jgi:hypothetical protein